MSADRLQEAKRRHSNAEAAGDKPAAFLCSIPIASDAAVRAVMLRISED
jgi:hypothetical protein